MVDRHAFRLNYTRLSARERVELLYASAYPRHDFNLADSLTPFTLFQTHQMQCTELRMLIFGNYWLSRLLLLHGFRLGRSTSSQQTNHDHMYNELCTHELALAKTLQEFDDSHGGWLQGVIAILALEDVWQSAQNRSALLTQVHQDPLLHTIIDSYHTRLESMWATGQ